MRIDPFAEPKGLGELLAPVVDGNTDFVVPRFRAMGRFGFDVNTHQPQNAAGFQSQFHFEGRFGKAVKLRFSVKVYILLKFAIKAGAGIIRFKGTFGIVCRRHLPIVVKQRDFLLGIVQKSGQHRVKTQAEMFGKCQKRGFG